MISQKCFLIPPLPKLLKWFHSAEQNGRKREKIEKKKKKKKTLNDISVASGRISESAKLLKWFCSA